MCTVDDCAVPERSNLVQSLIPPPPPPFPAHQASPNVRRMTPLDMLPIHPTTQFSPALLYIYICICIYTAAVLLRAQLSCRGGGICDFSHMYIVIHIIPPLAMFSNVTKLKTI